MKLYDKKDDFNSPIVNFPFMRSTFPAATAYGVYISQLIRYSRACGSNQDFLDRGLLLTRNLLNQGLSWSHQFESLRLPQWPGCPLWNMFDVRAARTLVFCVMFCISLFVLFLLSIVLSVLLRRTASDYPLISSNYSYTKIRSTVFIWIPQEQ